MAKILVVEDDKTLANNVKQWLELENHVVDLVLNGEEARSHLKHYPYDIIVLDIGLPAVSGLEVLKTFRESGGATPVLLLTGKDTVDDKATGLDSGADDYLTKPFHVKELSARIRALLRRKPQLAGSCLTYRDLTLDPDTRVLKRGVEEIKLSSREFALLEFLLRNPGHVFSPQALVDRVWTSYSDVSPESVRTYITRLRAKIDREGEASVIESIYGSGYKLSIE